MKKTLLLLSLSLTCFSLNTFAAPTPAIVTIPDANFKNALLADPNVNTNNDTEIQVTEAAAVVNLDVSSKSIASLTGIEAFTSLSTLACYSNNLISLNLSTNTALTVLDCGNNSLSSLNLSTNVLLTYLDCTLNSLMNLDLSANTALATLFCNDNLITALTVNSNPVLTNLHCYNNQIAKLKIDADTILTNLECYNNLIDTLDVRTNSHLSTLYCNDNKLTNLDVSKNKSLTYLDCSNNNTLTKICVNTTELALTSSNASSWIKPAAATWSTTNCADSVVGIEEYSIINTPKTLIHILNLYGQEIDPNEVAVGVIYIYQYSDGSVQKIVRL